MSSQAIKPESNWNIGLQENMWPLVRRKLFFSPTLRVVKEWSTSWLSLSQVGGLTFHYPDPVYCRLISETGYRRGHRKEEQQNTTSRTQGQLRVSTLPLMYDDRSEKRQRHGHTVGTSGIGVQTHDLWLTFSSALQQSDKWYNKIKSCDLKKKEAQPRQLILCGTEMNRYMAAGCCQLEDYRSSVYISFQCLLLFCCRSVFSTKLLSCTLCSLAFL